MDQAPQRGRARAEMVLGTFAETKVPRRAGAKPRINNFHLKEKGGVGMGEISLKGRNDKQVGVDMTTSIFWFVASSGTG